MQIKTFTAGTANGFSSVFPILDTQAKEHFGGKKNLVIHSIQDTYYEKQGVMARIVVFYYK